MNASPEGSLIPSWLPTHRTLQARSEQNQLPLAAWDKSNHSHTGEGRPQWHLSRTQPQSSKPMTAGGFILGAAMSTPAPVVVQLALCA